VLNGGKPRTPVEEKASSRQLTEGEAQIQGRKLRDSGWTRKVEGITEIDHRKKEMGGKKDRIHLQL